MIIGTGGLGQFGVQYAKLLLPAGTTIVAMDVVHRELEIARDLKRITHDAEIDSEGVDRGETPGQAAFHTIDLHAGC